MDQDVGRFQVAMNNIKFSQIFEPLADLPEHIEDNLFFFFHIFFITVQKISQITASAVLRNDIEKSIVLT